MDWIGLTRFLIPAIFATALVTHLSFWAARTLKRKVPPAPPAPVIILLPYATYEEYRKDLLSQEISVSDILDRVRLSGGIPDKKVELARQRLADLQKRLNSTPVPGVPPGACIPTVWVGPYTGTGQPPTVVGGAVGGLPPGGLGIGAWPFGAPGSGGCSGVRGSGGCSGTVGPVQAPSSNVPAPALVNPPGLGAAMTAAIVGTVAMVLVNHFSRKL